MTNNGWYASTSSTLQPFLRMPKVDLHRHLEGSLRLETLLDVARTHGIDLPPAPAFHTLVQMQRGDPFNFATFLSKFQLLRQFYRSPEVIARVTREAIADAAADGVLHLELRFTPVALARARGFALGEVIDWVIESARAASQEHNISVALIASVNRNESVALAEQVAALAADRIKRGIAALDLAGNEANFPAAPFAPLFREVQRAGLHVLAHAGEWSGAANVREAIEVLGAERVAHGVRVMEDPAVAALARERRVPFEVCLTSNIQSGVVASLGEHPLPRMLEAGLVVTLNTDDPSISQITLSEEYRLAVEMVGLSRSQLGACIQAAARATLLPPDQQQALCQRISDPLSQAAVE